MVADSANRPTMGRKGRSSGGDSSGRAVQSEKRRIAHDIVLSLSKDPLSVQFLWPWFWSLLPGHSPLDDSIPWMTFRAIRWLESYLRPSMDVFEYGAGGSTLFFAKRVRTLTSIENDPSWHDRVSRVLRDRGITNCHLRLIPARAEPTLRGIPYGPTSYTSTTPEWAGHSFEEYVRSIDACADHSLDLVAVDGHARFSCVTHAISKVRPGGYLLLDNSDWKKYDEVVASLAPFPRTDFGGAGPFQPAGWRTSIWRM
jgi:hypothetical protein